MLWGCKIALDVDEEKPFKNHKTWGKISHRQSWCCLFFICSLSILGWFQRESQDRALHQLMEKASSWPQGYESQRNTSFWEMDVKSCFATDSIGQDSTVVFPRRMEKLLTCHISMLWNLTSGKAGTNPRSRKHFLEHFKAPGPPLWVLPDWIAESNGKAIQLLIISASLPISGPNMHKK